MNITKNKVVSIAYILKDNDGQILDSSSEYGPLEYLHGGYENILPALEKELEGKEKGYSFKKSLSAAEAYGERNEKLILQVPKSKLDYDGELEIGMQFEGATETGYTLMTITDIKGDTVTVDGNHPLAGMPLNFDISVLEVRDATAEEIEHGHIHGSGCGDGECDCEDCGHDDEDCDCANHR